MTAIKYLKAFALGVVEFRSDLTTHMTPSLINTYDYGRELAHRVTFRHWDR